MIYELSYEEYSQKKRELVIKNIKFCIFSEFEACNYKPTTNKCLLIRIKDPNSRLDNLKHKKDFYKISTYTFEDIPFDSDKYLVFNEKIAKSIIKKIKSDDYKEIVVHCKAGISRSSSVMYGISKILNTKPLEEFILNSGYFIPNKLVMDVFRGVLNEKK